MKGYVRRAAATQRDFEKKANPNDKQQAALLEEMRSHIKKACPQWEHPLSCISDDGSHAAR